MQTVKFHTEDGSALLIDGEVVAAGTALLHGELAEWLHSGGQIAPYLTVTSAEWSNPENTAVMARTEEAGRVLVTPNKLDRWTALTKWVAAGGVIAPFVDREAEAREKAAAEAEKAEKRKALLDAMIDAGVTPEAVLSMKT
jgi:hypothetical protein